MLLIQQKRFKLLTVFRFNSTPPPREYGPADPQVVSRDPGRTPRAHGARRPSSARRAQQVRSDVYAGLREAHFRKRRGHAKYSRVRPYQLIVNVFYIHVA